MEKLQELRLDPKQFGLHSLNQAVHQLQQMLVYQIAGLKSMEDGFLRMPWTVMLRTSSKTGSALPEVWAYNIFEHSTSYFL